MHFSLDHPYLFTLSVRKSVSVILLATGLAACGGGGSDAITSAPSVASNLVATSVRLSATSAACPNGGIVVNGGIDSNGNKVLDDSEITSTQNVCNGTPGTNGTNGANGLTTLVLVTSESAGTNCPTGGKKIAAGQDANSNAVLDAGEVSSTAYVCNGTNGTNGANGTNGSNGANGLSSLTSIVPEPAGAMCTYGGSKVSNGMDSNANSVLDAAEVTASNYVCNGAPGATGPTGATGLAGPGLMWVNVTGTTQQAAANTGYLANNDISQVTITLPSAPVLGDIVQVSGIGTGGWKIAQNAGQSILTKNLPGGFGATWTARETNRTWYSLASSADGNKLVAGALSGQLYTSADAGVTWTARETARNWYAVASSADGSKLAAADYGGQLYTSADAGVTWIAREAARNWYALASSADGSRLVAAVNGGQLYTSTDAGVTWTARETARIWVSVAMSADGSKLLAANYGGQLYTSSDVGVTWTARDVNRNWRGVTMSADGSKLLAANYGGQLYTSTDGGLLWTARETTRNWLSVASSADGNKLLAGHYGGQLYTSIDAGVTWTTHETSRNWYAVAISADGAKLAAAAVGLGGQLYTSIAASTTIGVAGFISGAQYDAVDLQCVGNNVFMVRGYVGALTVQ